MPSAISAATASAFSIKSFRLLRSEARTRPSAAFSRPSYAFVTSASSGSPSARTSAACAIAPANAAQLSLVKSSSTRPLSRLYSSSSALASPAWKSR